MHDLGKLKGLAEWRNARCEIESAVTDVLGYVPPEKVELQVKTLDELSFSGYVRRRISYFVDEWERVSAWLFIPEGKDEVPAILCCHDMVAQGKDEPAGIEGNPILAFARHYAELGYVTLAPDCVTAGERKPYGLQPYDTRSYYTDHPKTSALAKMLLDHRCALDALCEMRRVDAARLGVIGHGMGGYNALFLAAFDERVQCCVSSCGFTRFADDKHPERWASNNGFVQLPQLKSYIEKKSYPFDWEHVLALAAPSPTLVITAVNDERLSGTKSCEKALKLAKNVYRLLGAAGALEQYKHHDGHTVTETTLERADDWFERWL